MCTFAVPCARKVMLSRTVTRVIVVVCVDVRDKLAWPSGRFHCFLRVRSSSACGVFDAGRRAHPVQVLQGLAVGGDEAGLFVGDADLGAVCLDDRLRLAQVGGRHGREQVVFDLVVQAAERHVGQPVAVYVAGRQHLLAEVVLVPGRVRHALVVGRERHAEVHAEQRLVYEQEGNGLQWREDDQQRREVADGVQDQQRAFQAAALDRAGPQRGDASSCR